jgi:hypothetical protein
MFDRNKMEPLYFLGISPKRYALANFIDGKWVIRKASAHGAATISQPEHYDPPAYPETAAEHIAAPLKECRDRPGEFYRDYRALTDGRAPRLMLDLWRLAFDLFADTNNIRQNLDERFRLFSDLDQELRPHTLLARFIRAHEQLQIPQATEVSITTHHMWKLHAEGDNPIPNIRPGMFLQTLPEPVYYCPYQALAAKSDERQRFKRTLIADDGLKLSNNLADYPIGPDGKHYGLYWRDTHEFPYELFTNQEPLDAFIATGVSDTSKKYHPHLKTIADGLENYFNHPNSKAADPYHSGMAGMREIIIAGVSYIGKCSNPMLSAGEGDDDETLEEESGAQTIVNFILNHRILKDIDLDKLSELTGIAKTRLDDLARGTVKAYTREGRAILPYLRVDDDGAISLKTQKPISRLSRFLQALSDAGKRDHGRGYDKIAAMTGIDLALLRNVNSPNHKSTLTGDKVRVVELFPSGSSKHKAGNTFSADAVLKAIAELKGTSKRTERRKKQRASDMRRKQKHRFNDKAAAIGSAIDNAAEHLKELILSSPECFLWTPSIADEPKKSRREAAQKQMGEEAVRLAKRAYETEPFKVEGIDFEPWGIRYIGPSEKVAEIDPTARIEARTLEGERRLMPLMEAARLGELWTKRKEENRLAAEAYRNRKKAYRFSVDDRVQHEQFGLGVITMAAGRNITVLFDDGLMASLDSASLVAAS